MKRSILFLLVSALLCASLLPAALAEEYMDPNTGTALAPSARVYAQPQPDADVVGQITRGYPYPIVEIKDGWARVELPDGTIGWTPASAIDYALAIPEEAWTSGLRRAVVLVEGLSLRESPSESAKRLVLMPNGSHGYILEEQETWLRAFYWVLGKNNKHTAYTGWIQREYTVENPVYIHLQNRTRVLAYASPDAPVVGLTQTGLRLPVIGEVDGYYVVNFRSASGFIPQSAPMRTERQIIEGY
jgi:SH3-like domain-containing protein